TGGMGLGCKSPFSYSDTFNIETRVNGILYLYSCYIDATNVGKLAPLDKMATDAENGTEIIIPVKKQDFGFFNEYTEFVTRHWDVKPIIKGDKLEWDNIDPAIKGKDWAIIKSDGGYRNKDIKLIIDGIEYPLNITQLKGYANTKLLDAIRGTIYLYFGVGELSLSASREAVHLDKETQEKISQKIDAVLHELKNNIINKIDAFSNLWDVNVYHTTELRGSFDSLEFLGKLAWKNIPLYGGYVNVDGAMVHEFIKGKCSRRGADPNKISKSMTKRIQFKEKSVIYLNDLGVKEPGIKHVSKAFENDSGLETIQVVTLNEKVTWADINKKYHFDEMNPQKLSSITKSIRTYNISGVRLLVFKFDLSAEAFRQVSFTSMEEDTNDKCICMLERDSYNNTRRVVLKNSSTLTAESVKSIFNGNKKLSIYGIDNSLSVDKIEEKFSDFMSIDKYIDDNILNNNSINYVEIKYAAKQQHKIHGDTIKLIERYRKNILIPDSPYLKYLELQSKIKDNVIKNQGTLNLYERVKGYIQDAQVAKFLASHPEDDLDIITDKITKLYPLIGHLEYYSSDQIIQPLVHYINLVDKELKNTNKI
ncbi:MAG TPA: hypothetical protein VNW06_00480, partial [Cytophagaceae bacterium]|nr:hypothetical protein [Cytophagaceae bacterium]